jgi:hypothetical protein
MSASHTAAVVYNNAAQLVQSLLMWLLLLLRLLLLRLRLIFFPHEWPQV